MDYLQAFRLFLMCKVAGFGDERTSADHVPVTERVCGFSVTFPSDSLISTPPVSFFIEHADCHESRVRQSQLRDVDSCLFVLCKLAVIMDNSTRNDCAIVTLDVCVAVSVANSKVTGFFFSSPPPSNKRVSLSIAQGGG